MNSDVVTTFSALASPIRLAVVQRLAHGPAVSSQLAQLGPVSRPAMSQHLRVLGAADLVHAVPSGRNVWYQLRPGPLSQIAAWADDVLARSAAAPGLRCHHAEPHESRG